MHTCRADLHAEGLQDDCPRCAELARNPIRDLDEAMLASLVRLAVRRDRLAVARSEAEAVASAGVLTVLERAGRLAEVAGPSVALYLRERWRLDASIGPPRGGQ